MSSEDLSYLIGTIGFFFFAVLGTIILVQWRREMGTDWLTGIAGLLAILVVAALAGYGSIGLLRLLTFGGLEKTDAHLIIGAFPWVAAAWVSAHMRWYPWRVE